MEHTNEAFCKAITGSNAHMTALDRIGARKWDCRNLSGYEPTSAKTLPMCDTEGLERKK